MHTSEKHQYWLNTIEQQVDSGQSAAAFCKENNLAEHNFYYWRKKLSTNVPTTIYPLVIDDDDVFAGNAINVALPNGVRAEFPIQLSPSQIQVWLKALQC